MLFPELIPDIEGLTEKLNRCSGFFFKFISANESRETGSHQAGIYMPSGSWPLFFDRAGRPDEIKDVWVDVDFYDGRKTKSRYVWYASKSEYRLTNGFNFLEPQNTGDLLVLGRKDADSFFAAVIEDAAVIEEFLNLPGICSEDATKLLKLRRSGPEILVEELHPDHVLEHAFESYLKEIETDFPPATEVARAARQFSQNRQVTVENADRLLLEWLDMEYRLFKFIEKRRFDTAKEQGFDSVEDFMKTASSLMNRRKSRAGLSLEIHLRYIFDQLNVSYSTQAVTENKKRPDFLFPSAEAYKAPDFPAGRLKMLAVKTTCKDRWRQVLSEANRISLKHLFTLQKGITGSQLSEMEDAGLQLVVPEPNLAFFPPEHRKKILPLSLFIESLEPDPHPLFSQ